MINLLLAVLLTLAPAPPSVDIALEPQGALITVWVYNTDARYEDFTLHVAGKPDVPMHVPTGAIETTSMVYCGQFDMTAETATSAPIFIGHYTAVVRCRKFYVSFP